MNSSAAIDPDTVPDKAAGRGPFGRRLVVPAVRTVAASVVAVMFVFLISNYLNVAHQWPGLPALFAHYGWFGLEALRQPLSSAQIIQGWLQLFSYLAAGGCCAVYVLVTSKRSLQNDSDLLSGLAAYIIRASFWAVLIIGLADITISFLRVEELLAPLLGEGLTQSLGRAHFRGLYVHYPLLLLSFIIALFSRSLGFIWLTLLVVLAEFVIVISRFVFSYEQPFMGDLVRFWYAALFLFASAHTLVSDGHVRVDVLYSRFRKPAKAWVNIVGTLLLGLPLAWIILVTGMWDKTSSINSPLYSFEVSQSGYGLYVKYLMVGFLAVYAVSMIVQFASYLLYHVANLHEEQGDQSAPES
jgi:TRAP-type mannitol/chloroaromatic compound transport system permease small subunit